MLLVGESGSRNHNRDGLLGLNSIMGSIYIYAHIHRHSFIHIYIYTHIHIHVHVHVHVHVHIHIYIYIYIYTHTYIYIWTHWEKKTGGSEGSHRRRFAQGEGGGFRAGGRASKGLGLGFGFKG